jgi:predicted RNase H-like HicB family nuclease
VEFTASIWKEGRLYVARCIEIGVASHGSTRQRAVDNLREAVELYIEDLPSNVKIARAEIARFRVAV